MSIARQLKKERLEREGGREEEGKSPGTDGRVGAGQRAASPRELTWVETRTTRRSQWGQGCGGDGATCGNRQGRWQEDGRVAGHPHGPEGTWAIAGHWVSSKSRGRAE